MVFFGTSRFGNYFPYIHYFRYQSLRRTIRGQRRAGESNRPTILPQEDRQADNEPIHDRPRHLSRRQQGEATQRPKPMTAQQAPTDGPNAAQSQTASSTPTSSTNRSHERISFEDTPGCRFIRRRDFFQFVNNHAVCLR